MEGGREPTPGFNQEKSLLFTVKLTILVFTSVWLLVWVLREYLSKPSLNLPPGPRGWPFLGILPSLGMSAPHERLAEVAAKYGGLFTCYFGVHRVVVLGDYETITEALGRSGDAFSDRPRLPMFTEIREGKGIAGAFYGKHWKEQRAWTFNALRGLGLGKDNFAVNITTEIGYLCDRLKANPTVPLDPNHSLNTAVSNIVCSIAYGTRYEYDSIRFKRMLALLQENFELAGMAGLVNFFPFLKYVPLSGFRKFRSNLQELISSLVTKSVREHLRTFNKNNIRDFIDAYLNEIRRRSSDGQTSPFTEDNLTWVIADLFAVGTETTALTLRWALLYMIVHPGVQCRVQEELDEVVGRARMPSMEERPRLNYTRAVISEIQRIRYIAAITVPRATIEDTKLYGYDIPKGTTVMPVMWAVMHNAKTWPEPDQFRPERFLDERGQYRKHEHFLPYGTGRRMCPGERLASMEVFLFFTNLLHQFNFTLPLGAPEPSLKGRMGITLAPEPFELIATGRQIERLE